MIKERPRNDECFAAMHVDFANWLINKAEGGDLSSLSTLLQLVMLHKGFVRSIWPVDLDPKDDFAAYLDRQRATFKIARHI